MKTHPPQEETALNWDAGVGLSERGLLKEILQISTCLLV